jgi:hypothetical protein
MSKFKPFLITGLVVLVVMAIVNRISTLKTIVTPN